MPYLKHVCAWIRRERRSKNIRAAPVRFLGAIAHFYFFKYSRNFFYLIFKIKRIFFAEKRKKPENISEKIFNLSGLSDQLIVLLDFAENGWAQRSLKREAKLRIKN